MSRKKPAPKSGEPRIVNVRGQRVMLDSDLAAIYGVPTKRFNEAFKRNRHRFPDDFAFQLTAEEFANLRSQFATSSLEDADGTKLTANSSQIARSSHGGRRSRPWAFTEHGALMAANILRSECAVEMSVYVVRAFVKQREQLAADADILKRLSAIDEKLLQHDGSIVAILNLIKALIGPPALPPPPPPKPRIGFKP